MDQTSNSIFDLLNKGEIHIAGNKPYNDIVLLLGITGSGKTTFSHFITGHDNLLYSVETSEDSGEFIIVDTNDKISNSTISSKTIFPELIVDTETGTAFYDCPGFSDTRSAAHDIAGTYFIKKILDSASRVKLLFITNHSSVRHGVDRQQIMTFLRHVLSMVKNLDNFTESMALIVTKVENQVKKIGTNYIPVSDKDIIQNISKFLREVLENLEKLQSEFNATESEYEFYRRAIKFVNVFLSQDTSKDFMKIGIFRRPDEAGLIKNIKLLQNGKKKLMDIINRNTHYSTVSEDDFDYTISSDSKNYLNDLVETINNNITSCMSEISKNMYENFILAEYNSLTIEKLREQMKLGYNTMSAYFQEITSSYEIDEFLSRTIRHFTPLQYDFPLKYVNRIYSNNKYLLFIKRFHHSHNRQSDTWVRQFFNLKNYFEISQLWYDFLFNLEPILSSYEIQQNMNSFLNATNDLIDPLSCNKKNHSHVIKNLQSFLKEINKYYGTSLSWSFTESYEINETKLRFLKELLISSLKYKLERFCDNKKKTLTVRGKYVKMSDVELIMKNCPSAIVYNVFAVKTIFLDTNFNAAGKKLQLSIIAPKWVITNNITIILNGKDGESHNSQKAINGVNVGARGEDGKPGKPGDSAGNFFGIGENFKNHNQLLISVNGGMGGHGQAGGDGASGKDREMIDDGDLNPQPFTPCEYIIERRFPLCPIHSSNNIGTYSWLLGTFYTKEISILCPPLISPGGMGGDGGSGGRGGKAGTINFITLNNEKIKLSTSAEQGRNGSPGIGGKGGKGGRGAKFTIKTRAFIMPIHSEPLQCTCMELVTREFENVVYNVSKDGVTGKNMNEIEDGKNPIDFFENPSQVINTYKVFLRENLNDIVGSEAHNFLDILEKNIAVNSLYNTFTLIEDLQLLESQAYRLRNEINVMQYYESLLQRIALYTKYRQDKESSDEYKKILSYLYAATLSGKRRIMDSIINTFIVDIDPYLDAAISDINDLNVLNNAIKINSYRRIYKAEANEAIGDANNFITKQLSPKIETFCEQLDIKLGGSIQSLVSLMEKEYVKERQIMVKQKNLEQYLVSKKYLSIINVVSCFLNFLGPVGTAINMITFASTQVIDSMMFEKMENVNNHIDNNLSGSIEKIKSSAIRLSDQLKEQPRLLAEQLYDMKLKFEKELAGTTYSQYFETKANEVTNLTNFSHSQSSQGYLTSCNIIRENVLKFIKIEKDKVTESPNNGSQKKKKLLEKAEQILSIVDVPLSEYNKIRTHEKEIENLAKSVREAQSNIAKIKDLEKSIFDDIAPIFETINNTVTSMSQNLNHKRSWVFDTARWKVSSTLRSFRVRIKKIAKEVKLDIIDVIAVSDDLEDGMFTLIKMYDTIDQYREKNKLADYIANVNCPEAIEISITDEKLKDSLHTLKFITQSNMILEKYEMLTHALKQRLFPFKYYNCEATTISQHFNNMTDLISQVIPNIYRYKSCLTYDGATISKYDHLVNNNVFFRKSNSEQPFFIWEWNKHKTAISDLLEGKEVVLKSHMNNFANAVKFNEIGICLRSTNTDTQHSVETELQNYRVIITHLGNSYYKCDDKVFIISSKKLIFAYDYYNCSSGNVSQQIINKNLVYDKISKNVPLLSPYATWSLKLVPKNYSDNLTKYRNEPINISLEGRGSYVVRGDNSDLCQQNFEHYYSEKEEYETVQNDDDIEKAKVYHSRNRRQTNWPTTLLTDDLTFTKSAASTVHGSFFINAMIDKIKNWFNFYNCERVIQTDYYNDILTNECMTTNDVYQLTNICELLNVNNLLFFDYIIRRKSANKNKRVFQSRNITSDYELVQAQSMAYNYYV